MGKHQVDQEVEREERNVVKSLYCGFHEKESVKQGKLGLAGLNNFSRLWGTGALSGTWSWGGRTGR